MQRLRVLYSSLMMMMIDTEYTIMLAAEKKTVRSVSVLSYPKEFAFNYILLHDDVTTRVEIFFANELTQKSPKFCVLKAF